MVDHLVDLVQHLGVEVSAQKRLVSNPRRTANKQHARAAAAGVDFGRANPVPRHARAEQRVVAGGEAGEGEGRVEALCLFRC